MSVIATLNVGRNGATSKDGSSEAISTPADRQRFLALHRSAGTYLLGRNSYLAERYSSPNTQIFILSKSNLPIASAPENVTIIAAPSLIESAREIYKKGTHPIVVEAGISLLIPLIESGCIEELELSISPIDGDAHFIDVQTILSHFQIIEDTHIDGTRLLKCRYQGDSAYRKNNS